MSDHEAAPAEPSAEQLAARVEQLEMLVKKVTEENVLLRSAMVGLGTRLDRLEAAPPPRPARRQPSSGAASRPSTAHTPTKYGTLPRNTKPSATPSKPPAAASANAASTPSAVRPSPSSGSVRSSTGRRARQTPSSGGSVRSSAAGTRTPLSKAIFHAREPSETPTDDGIDPARKGSYNVGNRKIHYTLPEGMADADLEQKEGPAEDSLELAYAFGFNGSARNNVLYANDGSGRLIYHLAAVGIVLDPATRKQSHFIAHNEDILCIAQHPTEPVVATAQLDPKGAGTPYICVWDYNTRQELARITHHDRGICAIAFSPGGRFVASVGMDDSRTVAFHDWRAHKEGRDPLIETMTSKDQVFSVAFRPSEAGDEGPLTLVALGVKLVKVFTVTNLTGAKKERRIEARSPSSFGQTKMVQRAYHAVAFRPDGSFVASTQSGHLYEFGPGATFVRAVAAHGDSVVGSVAALADGAVLSVGDDGKIRRWTAELKEDGEARALPEGCGNARALAVDAATGRLAVGTKSGMLLQLPAGAGEAETLMDGHTGEVWALAVHPERPMVATGAHDRAVRVWNSDSMTPASGFLHRFETKGEYVRSAAFSPDGKRLAVGLWTGRVVCFDFGEDSMAVAWEREVAKETVDALAYSPDGKWLAAGSWDQMTHVLSAADGAQRRTLRGHTSSVLMLQWSTDSKHLQTNSRDYEILFWDALSGQRLRRGDAADLEWDGWSCFLGWPVQGIWEECGDGTDINAVSRGAEAGLLAAGDDFGMVRLYKWPAVGATGGSLTASASSTSLASSSSSAAAGRYAPRAEFAGHSSHVSNVRWNGDSSMLFSTGGADTAVFAWRRK